MATGCERSVLLMAAALSLFCILGVCTGHLSLDPIRGLVDPNAIMLTCSDTVVYLPVRNAVFYKTAPGGNRMIVNESSELVNFRRITAPPSNGGVIMFTLTPDTEATFSCASDTTSQDETSGLLLAGGKSSSEE